jgi:hypothetical protein
MKRQQREPERRSARRRRDETLKLEIRGCSMRTSGCMGSARCGSNSTGRALRWPSARCGVSCVKWGCVVRPGAGRSRSHHPARLGRLPGRRTWSNAGSPRRTQPVVGFGHHLCGHLEWVRLRVVRDRCLRPADRRVASATDVAADRSGVRRGRTSHLGTSGTFRDHQRVVTASLLHHSDAGCAVPVDPIRRTSRRLPGSNRRSGRSATRMTMPWPSR